MVKNKREDVKDYSFVATTSYTRTNLLLIHGKFIAREKFKVGLQPPELEALLFAQLCALKRWPPNIYSI